MISPVKKESLVISIVILFYSIGAVGALIPTMSDWFLSLTPFNLLLTLLILIFSKKSKKFHFFLFLLFTFIVGITVELIGVHTGLLFGNYTYGNNLGPKFYQVPLIIGVNWGIVAVASSAFFARFKIAQILKIFLSTLLMVILDILIEPISGYTDFWYWENNLIPIYNFICWFLVGLFIQAIFYLLKLEEQNKVYEVLLITLMIFFMVLNVHYLWFG